MNPTRLLLNAYYECLYEQLHSQKTLIDTRVEQLLREEISLRQFDLFDREKFTAYLEAARAFVLERIETYNPIGLQYTFDSVGAEETLQFEAQLNWYDSRPEFESLWAAAHAQAQPSMSQQKMRQLARELIRQQGAYPDKTIISTYQAQPSLQKLPDYIVARALEQILREQS